MTVRKMTELISWLKKNYKTILLVSIPILLVCDLLTRWLFILHLEFDATNFNNVATPIGAIVSTVLFFFALMQTIRQNKIIMSQNLQPHFDKAIDKIEDVFKTQPNIIEELHRINNTLLYDGQFMADLHTYKDQGIPRDVLSTRGYLNAVNQLNKFATNPLGKYEQVKSVVERINKSQMIEDDKTLLKIRLKPLVGHYLYFISFADNHQHLPRIPILHLSLSHEPVKFEFVHITEFRRYFNFFTRELSTL